MDCVLHKEPIETWHGMVLTDIYVYELFEKYNRPFLIREVYFETKEDALHYAALKQYEKLKGNPDGRQFEKYIIGRAYENVKKIEHEVTKKVRKEPFSEDILDETKHNYCRTKSTVITANSFNVSTALASECARYSQAIDRIYEKNEEIAKELLSRKYKMSMVNTISLSEFEKGKIEVAYKRAVIYNDYSLINALVKNKKKDKNSIKVVKTTRRKSNPQIKIMPEYDPDAEINTLSYTIPAWRGSVQRIMREGDLKHGTDEAKQRLCDNIDGLMTTLKSLKRKIKETN